MLCVHAINYCNEKHFKSTSLKMFLIIYFLFTIQFGANLRASSIEQKYDPYDSNLESNLIFGPRSSHGLRDLESIHRSSYDCCTDDHTCRFTEKCSDCNTCVSIWNFKELAKCKLKYGFGPRKKPRPDAVSRPNQCRKSFDCGFREACKLVFGILRCWPKCMPTNGFPGR